MSCTRKQNDGYCNHFQCPFPDQSGVRCVDLIEYDSITFCERGEGCNPSCLHSFNTEGTNIRDVAAKAWLVHMKTYFNYRNSFDGCFS